MGSSVVDVRGVMKGRAARCGRRGQGRGAGRRGGRRTGRPRARAAREAGISSAGGARRAIGIGQASTCRRCWVAIQALSRAARRRSRPCSQATTGLGGRLRLQARQEVDPGVLQAQRCDRQPGDLAAGVDGHQQPARRARRRRGRRGQRAAPPRARRAVGTGGGLLRLEPVRRGGRGARRRRATRPASGPSAPGNGRPRAGAGRRRSAAAPHRARRRPTTRRPAASGAPYSARIASSASWTSVSVRPVPWARPRAPTSTACQPPSVNALNAPMMVGTLRPVCSRTRVRL